MASEDVLFIIFKAKQLDAQDDDFFLWFFSVIKQPRNEKREKNAEKN